MGLSSLIDKLRNCVRRLEACDADLAELRDLPTLEARAVAGTIASDLNNVFLALDEVRHELQQVQVPVVD